MSAGWFLSFSRYPRLLCCWWHGALRDWPVTIPMRAPPMGSWRRNWVPAQGWSRDGRCSGPISALRSSVLAAFGLFGADLLQRADLWHDASSFSLDGAWLPWWSGR